MPKFGRNYRRLKPTLQAEARATIVLHHVGWAAGLGPFYTGKMAA
jgi:hypothetical protein